MCNFLLVYCYCKTQYTYNQQVVFCYKNIKDALYRERCKVFGVNMQVILSIKSRQSILKATVFILILWTK